jgi:hypothetical protein
MIPTFAEHTFETAYSAAAWPASNFNIGKDDCNLVLGDNFTMAECTEWVVQIKRGMARSVGKEVFMPSMAMGFVP